MVHIAVPRKPGRSHPCATTKLHCLEPRRQVNSCGVILTFIPRRKIVNVINILFVPFKNIKSFAYKEISTYSCIRVPDNQKYFDSETLLTKGLSFHMRMWDEETVVI